MINKYNNVKLIGLCGAAGCGKDTLASLIIIDWTHVAFAQALKDICIQYLGLSKDDVYTQQGKMKYNDFWGMTNRTILQKVGTQAMRNNFHSDVWVKIAQLKVNKILSNHRNVIITDCRFDNEAQMVENLGGIMMKIQRNNLQSNLNESEQNHISEKGISEHYIASIILNDRDIPGLQRQFQYKLNVFQNRHKQIVDQLQMFDNKKCIDENITSKLILCLKKYISVFIDNVYYMDNKQDIRLEWYKKQDFYPSLITDKQNNKMIFQAINENDFEKNYKITFDFNDVENWKNVNNWLINNNY